MLRQGFNDTMQCKAHRERAVYRGGHSAADIIVLLHLSCWRRWTSWATSTNRS